MKNDRALLIVVMGILAFIADGELSPAFAGDAGRREVGPPAATSNTTVAGKEGEGPRAAPAVENVRVQVIVDPPQKAHVLWGVKDFGVAPLEIERPRGSGPLDLVLKAPGYLVVHTRAFTEHDDKLVVHLTPAAVAPASTPGATPASPSTAKPRVPKDLPASPE